MSRCHSLGEVRSPTVRTQLRASVVVPLCGSPYRVHAASAALDAALVEVVVAADDPLALLSPSGSSLAACAPGSALWASQPLGGFAPVTGDAAHGAAGDPLARALGRGGPLLLLGWGARGAGPLRAAAEWQPVAAAAAGGWGGAGGAVVGGGGAPSHGRGAIFVAAPSLGSCPFVSDFDDWRAAGFAVTAVASSAADGGADAVSELETALFGGRLSSLAHALGGGDPAAAVALCAGLPPHVAARVARGLAARGLDADRMLFSEPPW